jgi:trk system potassium uptake protein TrkH
MLSFRPVLYINGILLIILSLFMTGPIIADLSNGDDGWRAFSTAQIITAFLGATIMLINRAPRFHLSLKETFVMAGTSWLLLALFAAMPIYIEPSLDISFARAFFESMSGITTTGATALHGLDDMSHGLLLWRMILHWIGGIGFLIVALAILPLLEVSGMQIFKTQSFSSEEVMTSARHTASFICGIYTLLTLCCALLLSFAGLDAFNAICHAMSAISTGGFANSDQSIAIFNNWKVEAILIAFMIIGALPFFIYLRLMRGEWSKAFHDSQVRVFLLIIFILSCIVTAELVFKGAIAPNEAFHKALFMVTSIITTTGFASGDYQLWGPITIAIAFIAMFIGGCSGSTAGGIKVFRLQILFSILHTQIRRLFQPNGVFDMRYNGKPVESNLQAAVAGLFFAYIIAWLGFTFLLKCFGLEFTTAISGAASALSNVGPGLGEQIGPAGHFGFLPEPALWTLSAAMLFGRMEILTLLVLLTPRFWRG